MPLILSWILLFFFLISLICAMYTGNTGTLGSVVLSGADSGIRLAISLAGPLCLWTGVGLLMDRSGITGTLSRLLRPMLKRLFPSSRQNPALENALSANVCANLLGLGNAATPMGIQAVQQLRDKENHANDQMCRLVVLNTASIQLIPTTVAALRLSLGCTAPFDILAPVWITGFASAAMGLLAAWIMGKLWRN